jgi:hypothetical protein
MGSIGLGLDRLQVVESIAFWIKIDRNRLSRSIFVDSIAIEFGTRSTHSIELS